MTRDAFRERVKDVVVEMAATGQTGMGFPTEYGGGGDIGASFAAFETLAFGDLSVLVKVGVQFGLFGGAILQLGTKHHHDAYLADLITGKVMGCFAMTETGHGSNVQALGTVATYDAADPGVRDRDPGRAGQQGLHRQRRRARRAGRRLRAARGRRQVGGRARLRGADPRRSGKVVRRRTDRGRRPEDGPQRRRQRPDLVRRRPGAADGAAQPVRRRDARGRLRERDRQPQPPLLHDARHPGAGPRVRRRRRHQRRQGGADDRDEVRAAAAAVRGDQRGRTRSCCSTTACTSAGSSRCSRAPMRCTSPRRSWPASCTRSSPTTEETPEHREDASRARVAGGRHQGARHLARHPHHPGVPGGLRRCGLPVGQPVRRAEGRHRRLHDVRGRQPRAAAAGGEGPAHRLRQRLRGPRPVRDGQVRRQPRRSRPCWRRPACTSCSSGSGTCCPAARTAGTRRPGCSTRSTS